MRRHLTVASLAAVVLVAGACSGEDAFESIAENAIERESGGDVDVDLDFSDGGFSMETKDGSMTIDEDGNFVITDENGEVITGDVDVDGDGFSIETDEGDFSMEADEDGSVTFQSEEGEVNVDSAVGIPDDWPADIPQPSGLTIESGSSASTPDALQYTVLGRSEQGEQWTADYAAQLEGAGFTSMSTFTSEDGVQSTYQRGEQIVSLIGGVSDGSAWDVFVTVFIETGG